MKSHNAHPRNASPLTSASAAAMVGTGNAAIAWYSSCEARATAPDDQDLDVIGGRRGGQRLQQLFVGRIGPDLIDAAAEIAHRSHFGGDHRFQWIRQRDRGPARGRRAHDGQRRDRRSHHRSRQRNRDRLLALIQGVPVSATPGSTRQSARRASVRTPAPGRRRGRCPLLYMCRRSC